MIKRMGPSKWSAEDGYIEKFFIYFNTSCSQRIEIFIIFVRPMQLFETGIIRRFYKSASTSNQGSLVPNRG